MSHGTLQAKTSALNLSSKKQNQENMFKRDTKFKNKNKNFGN